MTDESTAQPANAEETGIMTDTGPVDASDAAAPARTGPGVISAYLKTLPSAPGVYRMLDDEGTVIYVGKARSLKARVSNYARLGGHSQRIARMISRTATMEFVTVGTEAEALLLEANLIKRFRPRFNVLMRDDKSFPYIRIADTNNAPQIMKHRGARDKKKGDFFGPFASAGAVDRTINMLQRAFLLRTCSDSVFESRTRPCLLYQIKRCSGPCTGEISPEDYKGLVNQSKRFLRGESQNVRRMYQGLMEEAAEALEYERAASYRNRLWALAHVTSEQSINAQSIEEADIFAAHQEGGQTCIQVFFFRSGQNWGNRAYFPKADRGLETEAVLESFIAQFYDDKPVPRLILLSHQVATQDLLAEALSIKATRKVRIETPQRASDKKSLVEHAHQNAREALGRRLAESSSQQTLLKGVAERFDLPHSPRRIEVYDNSHISGTNAVGGMIVAGPEGLIKNQYRKFNIKSDDIAAGDDYAMMREVLTRRFKRLISEHTRSNVADDNAASIVEPGHDIETPSDPANTSRITDPAIPPPGQRGADGIPFGTVSTLPTTPHKEPPREQGAPPLSGAPIDHDSSVSEDEPDLFADTPAWPDLVLVDGGAGQLSVAREVFAELGVTDVELIGVAKGPDRDAGREHFHRVGQSKPVMLEPRDPVLYFIQRLRDEAHRFAIGTHRAKRSKAITANPLDEITGIGPTRKRNLLQHFGSAKATSRAGIEDLKSVPGISAEMAQKIYDFFNDKKN